MKRYFSMLMLLLTGSSFCQDLITDAKGNFLFGIPTTTVQPTLASKNIGIESPIYFKSKTSYFVNKPAGMMYTVNKSNSYFIKFNVVNNSKAGLIFDRETNISPSLEVGYGRGIESLVNPSEKDGFYYTFAFSGTAEYQNFKFYDTNTMTFSDGRTNKISPGIKSNLTLFRKTNFAISMSASYKYAINTDKLVSYAERSNTFYFDKNISTNGNIDGYLSPVKSSEIYRASISFPLFFVNPSWNNKLPFYFAPYYHGTYTGNSKPDNNIGISLSFLSEKFNKFDSVRVIGNSNERYKFSKSFNIGYNFYNSTDNKGYIFLTGTFSLAKFLPKNINADQPE